ncbi:MAG TPA: TolC family protein [Polyangiaceae bacterium]
MSRLALALLSLSVVLAARSASAQEAAAPDANGSTAKPMSLADALAYAHAHQPAIKAALASIDAEKAQADVPRGAWLPTVGVTAQIYGATANNTTASYLSTPFVDLPRIGGTRSEDASHADWKPYASTVAAAAITQEIFDFGRIAAHSAAADALVDVRIRDAEAARLDVDFDVEEAFFAERAANGVFAAARDAYERAKVHRDLAKAGVGSGLRSPIELTRAEADLQRFDNARLRAQGGVEIAQSVLGAAIGAPETKVDAANAPQPAELPTMNAAIERASARDPRLLAVIANLKARELATKATRSELRPDISATAAFSGRAGGADPSSGFTADYSGLLPTVPNWDAGLVFSWPLFDGTTDARVSAAKAQEQVARDRISLEKQRVIAQVEQAYVEVDIARRTLPGLQAEIQAAIANYAQADARFKAGLGTSVELADAEALRTDAEIQLARGVFDLARARAAFGRVIAEGIQE